MNEISLFEALKSSQAKGQNTRELVFVITKRLSGRDDIKSTPYEICFESDKITFSPNVKVYPDRHRRKPTDAKPILEFVMMNYFPDVIDNIDNEVIHVKPNYFVTEGLYRYIVSADGKNRKWVSLR